MTTPDEEKDITILWQGPFEGGTLILFLSKKYNNILLWKIFDPSLADPLTGHCYFIATGEFDLKKFIDVSLISIRHTYLSFQQGLKDECITSGAKVQ